MEKGKLIVIEGACDGIGKTTQYKMLSKYFLENGKEVVKHHFPSYNTYQGTPVSKYLQGGAIINLLCIKLLTLGRKLKHANYGKHIECIWISWRSGNVPLRHEYHGRRNAEDSGRQDEPVPGDADQ